MKNEPLLPFSRFWNKSVFFFLILYFPTSLWNRNVVNYTSIILCKLFNCNPGTLLRIVAHFRARRLARYRPLALSCHPRARHHALSPFLLSRTPTERRDRLPLLVYSNPQTGFWFVPLARQQHRLPILRPLVVCCSSFAASSFFFSI